MDKTIYGQSKVMGFDPKVINLVLEYNEKKYLNGQMSWTNVRGRLSVDDCPWTIVRMDDCPLADKPVQQSFLIYLARFVNSVVRALAMTAGDPGPGFDSRPRHQFF